MVERQLCKLEVRGSNPLASKASKAWRQNVTTGHIFGCTSGSVIPCLQSSKALGAVAPKPWRHEIGIWQGLHQKNVSKFTNAVFVCE